jgi:signal transduction histidine kinase
MVTRHARGSGVPAAPLRWALPGQLAALDGLPHRPPRRTGRDWAVDVALFAFAVLMWWGAVYEYSIGTYDYVPRGLFRLDVVLGAAACLGLWLRRRFPLGFAVALIPVAAVSGSAVGATMAALVTVAVYRPWRQSLTVTVVTYAAGLPWILLLPPTPVDRIVLLIAVAAVLAACNAWGAAIRARRQLVLRLAADAERERAEHERRLADSRREERRRIAGEMHDVLAHRMSLLSVHAGALAFRAERAGQGAAPLSTEEIGSAARVIRDNAHQALDELGEVLHVLRSADTDASAERDPHGPPQPGLGEIARLVEEADASGQRVRCTGLDGIPADRAPRPQVQRTAYRIVQEGLTNARKHAEGAQVEVLLRGGPGAGLHVAVVNALPVGTAPAEIPGAGAGLSGLAERVGLDGGTMDHGLRDGAYHLTARLPWPA